MSIALLFLITQTGSNSRFIICGMDKLRCSLTLEYYSVIEGQIADTCNDMIDLKCFMLSRDGHKVWHTPYSYLCGSQKRQLCRDRQISDWQGLSVEEGNACQKE